MLKNGFLFTLGAVGASATVIVALVATAYVLDRTGLIEFIIER